MVVVVVLLLHDLLRNLISVTKVSSDSFLLSGSTGKDKEIILEKHMLSWGQTEEPWYLNLP